MKNEITLYKTPFQTGYWKDAAGEIKNLRTVILAAIFIAVRVALKTVYIPVGDGLNVYVGFIINALSGAVCGPVLALMSGAITDILGWAIAPQGAFNPVFTVIEMIGSLIYALWLYRSKITLGRIFASKLTVNVIVNIVLTSLAMSMMYSKAVLVYVIPRIVKNLILLPAEAFVLALFFEAMFVPSAKLGVLTKEQNRLKVSKVAIVVLTVIAIACVVISVLYYAPFNTAVKDFLKGIFGV